MRPATYSASSLIQLLRRKKIASLGEADRYLQEEYCAQHNARFAVPAAASEDLHLPSPGTKKLQEVFRLERERVLSQDWVVRDENRFYQVARQSQHHAPAKSKVTVCEGEDGSIEIHYRGQKLRWEEIAAPPKRVREPRASSAANRVPKKSWRPPSDHPWRRGYPERIEVAMPIASPSGAPSLGSASAPP